mmetsp:Transcript_7254/g.15826  ORF Transcript_7254/g.15826 Transcript_7254/m.15826 type:complete len:708 (+) Transcript_7254:280-2403(+)
MSDDYEDDFDNYDDDFENEEDYEVLPKSMTKASVQSSPPLSAAQRPSSARAKTPLGGNRPLSGNRPLDIPQFAGLSDTQVAAAKRRLALAVKKMKQVELQVVVIDDLFTMTSLSQYDLFNMARSVYANKKPGATQTSDDAKEEEVQTDEVDVRLHAAQVPDDRNAMTDAEVSASIAPESRSRAASSSDATPASSAPAVTRITERDPNLENKLVAFMQWAGPVILAALGTAPSIKSISLQADPHGGQGLGSGLVPLLHPDLLNNRPVNCTTFVSAGGPGDPLLLAAYGPMGAQLGAAELIKDHTLATKGCMCVWDIAAPSSPKHVLVSEGTPTCCGFAPAPATHIVFAGMEEGGLCVWDLEEAEGRHPIEVVGGRPLVTRRPSYSTEYLADVSTSGAPIVGVAATPKGGSRTAPCNLVSLSAWGEVTVWTLNVLSAMEGAAADVDLGMRVGSRVRLLRTATNVRIGMAALQPAGTGAATGSLESAVQAFALQVLPGHQRQFIVGADGGKVLRGSWVGLPPAPKEFIPADHNSAQACTSRSFLPACITSLHVSPFCAHAFLAGHDDGTIVLHSTDAATAAAMWPSVTSGRVVSVRWSPTRPCVFFALDSLCTVYCFDLTRERSRPFYSQSFMAAADPRAGGAASLATFLDVGTVPHKQGRGEEQEALPAFAVGYDDGRVDFHTFSPSFTQIARGELQVLQEIVGISSSK